MANQVLVLGGTGLVYFSEKAKSEICRRRLAAFPLGTWRHDTGLIALLDELGDEAYEKGSDKYHTWSIESDRYMILIRPDGGEEILTLDDPRWIVIGHLPTAPSEPASD